MRKLVIATLVSLAGISASYARGGGHGGGMSGGGMQMGGMAGSGMQGSGMTGAGMRSLAAPANPAVPPSLTSDPRLTGTAPLPSDHTLTPSGVASLPEKDIKPDASELAVDRAIGSICRGC